MILTWTKFHHDFLVVNIKKHDNKPCLSSWHKGSPSLFINVSNSTVWSELFMSSSPSAAGDREDSTTMYSWGSIQGWTRIQKQNRSCHERIYAFVCEYNIQWYNTTSHFSYFLGLGHSQPFLLSSCLLPSCVFCFMFWYCIFFSLEVVVFYLLALQFVLLLLLLLCLCLVYWKLLVASGWAKFSTSGETQIHFLNWHVCHTCIHVQNATPISRPLDWE